MNVNAGPAIAMGILCASLLLAALEVVYARADGGKPLLEEAVGRVRMWTHYRYVDARNKFAYKLAYWLPREVALLAFVRVYSVLGTCGDDYIRAYTKFDSGEGQ